MSLCQAYFKKEAWPKAVDACVKGAKRAPTDARFPEIQGMALVRQAQAALKSKSQPNWSEARAPLEEAIKKDPNRSDAYFELAEVLLHTDDENGALKNYTKAIETKPDESSYYGPLADLYVRLGYLDAAEQALKEGLSFAKEGDKHLFDLHSILGDVQERKGNFTAAVSSYEAAKKACGACTDPGKPIAFFNLGAIYANPAVKRNSEAQQQFERFSKLICSGAAKNTYAEQCAQADNLKNKVTGAAP
jgi:tetratricopeptide (TPR) repeat protein